MSEYLPVSPAEIAQQSIAAAEAGAAILGGHVRVGLEDSLYLDKGQMAENNAHQVAKIRHIIKQLSLEVATPHIVKIGINILWAGCL